MRKNKVVMILILSIFVAMLSTIVMAKVDSQQNQATDQSTQINANLQKMQGTVGPGKLVSVKTITSLPALPTVGNKIKNKDIPVRYAISKDKIDKLKKQPFKAVGKQPKTDVDKVIGNSLIKQPIFISGFEGLDNQVNIALNGFIVRPPDPDTAAGPNHIGTVTNDLVRFSTKAGTTVLTSSLGTWFSSVYTVCPNCLITDPKIAYDPVENHWIIIVLGLDFTNPSAITGVYLISASQTSDPTGSWFFYNIDGDVVIDSVNTFPDYPDLGLDYNSGGASGAIYVTSNNFDSGGSFHTSRLNIFPKNAIYQGAGFSFWYVFGFTDIDGGRSFTLRPVQTLSQVSSTSPIEYVVNTRFANGNFVTLWKIIPAFPPTLPGISGVSIPIGSYLIPPNAVQPCGASLDTIDNRLYQAVFRNGHIYSGFNDAFNFGSGTVSAVRFFDINTNTLSASQDVRYGADGLYYWFPAITTDTNNNIIFVFARTGPSVLAEVRYTGKKTTDPSTEPSALLKAGQECITGFRWGDYFGVGNDPVNINRVWIYGEYARADGISTDWDWGTFVGQVSS